MDSVFGLLPATPWLTRTGGACPGGEDLAGSWRADRLTWPPRPRPHAPSFHSVLIEHLGHVSSGDRIRNTEVSRRALARPGSDRNLPQKSPQTLETYPAWHEGTEAGPGPESGDSEGLMLPEGTLPGRGSHCSS